MFRTLIILSCAACVWAGQTYDDQRPMLGVQMSPTPLRIATQQGLSPGEGVYVRRVFPGTAASTMGVQQGDVITSINGRRINSMTELREVISSSGVGDPVDVQVRRGGQDVGFEPTELRRWPETIEYQEIDSRAEQRYIEMQRRMASKRNDQVEQHQRTLENLQREHDALQEQVAEREREAAGREPADEASDIADTAWQRGSSVMRRAKALGIDWSFTYRVRTDDPVETVEASPDEVEPVTDDALARAASPLNLSYAFVVHSEAL